MSGRWAPGETIVHHEVWANRVWAARPLVVVEDGDEQLVLWLPQGTTRKVPAPTPGSGKGANQAGDAHRLETEASHEGVIEHLESGTWDHTDHQWDVSSLWILRPGDWYAVWVSWLANGDHLGWYVNLQRPYRRTGVGIEAMDLMLDIVVDPDLTWRWKDAEEFELIVGRGIFDTSTVAHVRAGAAAAIERIEAAAPPFGEPWPAWRPDPAWSLPVLSGDWHTVPRGLASD